MADVEEEILLQANVYLLLVLKGRHRQLPNRLQSLRQRQIKFLPDFSPAVSLFVFVFEIFTFTVLDALISRNFLHKFHVT